MEARFQWVVWAVAPKAVQLVFLRWQFLGLNGLITAAVPVMDGYRFSFSVVIFIGKFKSKLYYRTC